MVRALWSSSECGSGDFSIKGVDTLHRSFIAMLKRDGSLFKSALVCVLAFPAVSRAFNPVIDYQMTGTMVIESAGCLTPACRLERS